MIYSDSHYKKHWKLTQWPRPVVTKLERAEAGKSESRSSRLPEEHSESHLFIEKASHIAQKLLILLPLSPNGKAGCAIIPSFKNIKEKNY